MVGDIDHRLEIIYEKSIDMNWLDRTKLAEQIMERLVTATSKTNEIIIRDKVLSVHRIIFDGSRN